MASVSIIIPTRTVTPELKEAIPHLLALEPHAHEILVVTDRLPDIDLPHPIRIITQTGGPATKRDAAARQAQGDILAFLDDDAYPRKDWIEKATRHFSDDSVAAVGGPAITPRNDPLWAQASGAFFTSWLGSGPVQNRYWPIGDARSIDDWPSVNLLVRKDIFKKIGGFDSTYWPGEDTKLCLDITKLGKDIIYEPRAVCYHHRATTFTNHLRQVARYGLHRGHFARVFPDTSWRFSYFLPTLSLLAALLIISLGIVAPSTWLAIGSLGVLVLFAVFLSGLIEAFRVKKWHVILLYPFIFFLSHTMYGITFVRGLVSPSLKQYSRSAR